MTDTGNGMQMDMKMMMPMSFWKGYDTELTWLVREWTTTTSGQYAGGLIVSFLLAVLLELLIYLRNLLYARAQIAAIKKTEQLNR